jgi:hypothetical protein
MIKTNLPFLPANRQGIAVDAVTVLLNLFLFPFFTGRVTDLFERSFGETGENTGAFKTLAVIMFFILGGRLFGLYVKRFPLQARRRKEARTPFAVYFFILNVPVLVMTAAFVNVWCGFLLAESGLVETNYNGSPKDSAPVFLIGIFAMLVATGLEIYFLARLSRPLDRAEKRLLARGDWRFGRMGETLADFGLFAYLSIWQVFYNLTARLFMTPAENVTQTFGLKIGAVIFLFVCFLIFYLAPRAVFLIEDRKHLGTWLFILFVFLSSIAPYW